jgi:hypothetical protein
LDAACGRDPGADDRDGATFRPETALLGLFPALEAVALVFFFMTFPVQARL